MNNPVSIDPEKLQQLYQSQDQLRTVCEMVQSWDLEQSALHRSTKLNALLKRVRDTLKELGDD